MTDVTWPSRTPPLSSQPSPAICSIGRLFVPSSMFATEATATVAKGWIWAAFRPESGCLSARGASFRKHPSSGCINGSSIVPVRWQFNGSGRAEPDCRQRSAGPSVRLGDHLVASPVSVSSLGRAALGPQSDRPSMGFVWALRRLARHAVAARPMLRSVMVAGSGTGAGCSGPTR